MHGMSGNKGFKRATVAPRGVGGMASLGRIPSLVWAFGALCLLLVGCKRKKVDLTESKPPNPLVAKKIDKVPGHTLAQDRKALYRSAQVSFAQANKILGGFVYKAKASYAYTRGGQKVDLNETYTMSQHADGPFRAVLQNNKQKGYEVIWTGKALYWRGRHRPFRLTSRDVAQALRWQQRGTGRWRALLGIFGRHLTLTEQGACGVLNRTCRKYALAFVQTPGPKVAQASGTAWKGALPDKTRGNAAGQNRTPTNARGTLWIDRQTGLVLKVRFRGSYTVGDGKEKMSAKVRLRAGFTRIGGPVIERPSKVVTIKREPEPLDAFGHKKPFFLQPPPSEKKSTKKPNQR